MNVKQKQYKNTYIKYKQKYNVHKCQKMFQIIISRRVTEYKNTYIKYKHEYDVHKMSKTVSNN